MICAPQNPAQQSHKQRSVEHFKGIYRTLDPEETAARTALPFEGAASGGGGYFRLRVMGIEYTAPFPEFSLKDPAGNELREGWKSILFLRYLCEGKYVPAGGKQLSYREIPWGNVYYRNFEGRCLRRFAHTFGADIEGFKGIMETNPSLKAERIGKSDAGYRFEFSSGLYMNVYVWAGDDEFPPSAQMLFDDNFPSAFPAEDIAVIGEVVIDSLKP
jgi:hypothetical protein